MKHRSWIARQLNRCVKIYTYTIYQRSTTIQGSVAFLPTNSFTDGIRVVTLACCLLVSYNGFVVLESHFINETDEKWMKLALAQAEHAAEIGEVPVGAIAILDEQVIGQGFNAKEANNDPTAHAEMMAIASSSRFIWEIGVLLASPFTARSNHVRCAPGR